MEVTMYLPMFGRFVKKSQPKSFVTIRCIVVAETNKGILLKCKGEKGWFPKRFVTIIDEHYAKVPALFALQHGFITVRELPHHEIY
jgi:hypothetical protein